MRHSLMRLQRRRSACSMRRSSAVYVSPRKILATLHGSSPKLCGVASKLHTVEWRSRFERSASSRLRICRIQYGHLRRSSLLMSLYRMLLLVLLCLAAQSLTCKAFQTLCGHTRHSLLSTSPCCMLSRQSPCASLVWRSRRI